MITLILCRHGDAGKPSKKYQDDNQRPVTSKGVKRLKKAAKGLKNLATPDVVLVSPMARTMQTADILNWDAGWPAAVAVDALDDTHEPSDVVKAIKKLKGKPNSVGLVGHGPNLCELVQYLTGADGSSIDFDKGGAASLTVPRKMKPSTGTLNWLMSQKELKKHQ